MTDSTMTASPLLARLATLERENADLRAELDGWRKGHANQKQEFVQRIQRRKNRNDH